MSYPMKSIVRIALMLALTLLSGCATYEFDLVKPERLAAHVGRKTELRAPEGPLEYRFIAYENRLVVRILNTTDEPIQLLGGQSSAVDPRGESHPLRSQMIAPGSFIKLILPPPRPQVYDPGPRIGFGFGIIGRAHPYHNDAFYAAGYDEPRYYTVYDAGDNSYWTWEGETTARLLLTFAQGNKTFGEEFWFRRKKM
jgi:hypothetical protein